MKQDYFYVVKELEDCQHNGLIKIGHSTNPLKRPNEYQTGNWRKLVLVLAILGGVELEKKFKQRFVLDKIESGGDEWYKFTEHTADWLFEHTRQSLIAVSRPSDIDFGAPINIPKMELGEAKTPLPRAGTTISSVRPHEVIEAQPPKNPYSRVGERIN